MDSAIIVTLVDALRSNGSWCGETHIQKASYFISRLKPDALSFDFILYKHGPFSFDLRDELTALRAFSFLDLDSETYPFGVRYSVASAGKTLQQRCAKFLKSERAVIDFVSSKLGALGVAHLERLATALYFTNEKIAAEERASKIHEVKPHITPELAGAAVKEVDQIRTEWQSKGSIKSRLLKPFAKA